jgi:hypothetical protein
MGPDPAQVAKYTRQTACLTLQRLMRQPHWLGIDIAIPVTGFQFIPEGFVIDSPDGDHSKAVTTLYSDIKKLEIHVGGDLHDWVSVFVNTSQGGNKDIVFAAPYWVRAGKPYGTPGIPNDPHAARGAKDAVAWMNAMQAVVEHPDWQAWMVNGEEKVFETALQEYQDAKGKLQLPEDARKYYEQALDAVDDKEFNDAIGLYQKTLAVAPWWPVGYYNCALIMADQGDYADAVDYGNKYLKLEPDSPDARKTQDLIYKWQRKAEKGGQAEGDEEEGQENKPSGVMAK